MLGKEESLLLFISLILYSPAPIIFSKIDFDVPFMQSTIKLNLEFLILLTSIIFFIELM